MLFIVAVALSRRFCDLGRPHAAVVGQEAEGRTPTSYRCELCGSEVAKLKMHTAHLAGKRHLRNVERAESWWREYETSGWYNMSSTDDAAIRAAVTREFDFDKFFEGLPRRTRSSTARLSLEGTVDPHIMLPGLSEVKRAQVWRYLREATADEAVAKAFVRLFVDLERTSPLLSRLKEILESVEVFKLAERIVIDKKRQDEPIESIFDLAAGHGLVAVLLAMRFPEITVLAVDLERRAAFGALISCITVNNLAFLQADLTTVKVSSTSLVLGVHACKEVNDQIVELAREAGAAWLVLPCCLKGDVKLTDDDRYTFSLRRARSEIHRRTRHLNLSKNHRPVNRPRVHLTKAATLYSADTQRP